MLLSMTVNSEARCCFNSIFVSVFVALISLKICCRCVIQQLLIRCCNGELSIEMCSCSSNVLVFEPDIVLLRNHTLILSLTVVMMMKTN